MPQADAAPLVLPCVVQIGFAGSRNLYGHAAPHAELERQWNDAVLSHLVLVLDSLPERLDLKRHHFLTGISSLARGADTLFTRACQVQGVPQRVFFPQPAADFFAAIGSGGDPDFTPQEQLEVQSLLASDHVIQARVVSRSEDRRDRFRETNAEIVRVSDVVICLLSDDAQAREGGTHELLRRAQSLQKPVLEIRVGVQDGVLAFRDEWHFGAARAYVPPEIPEPLRGLLLPEGVEGIPTSEQFCHPLKKLASTQAKSKRRMFWFAAAFTIALHILATLLATLALAAHGGGHAGPAEHAAASASHGERAEELPAAEHSGAARKVGAPAGDPRAHAERSTIHPAQARPLGERMIPGLLALELIALALGFGVHQTLHHSAAARIWANARVVAEIARSVAGVQTRHVYLEYLFRLPLPHRFRPLLRTLSVLHLRTTYANRHAPWEPQRDAYLAQRIEDQIGYFGRQIPKDRTWYRLCQGMFLTCSGLAMAATLLKLAVLIASAPHSGEIAFWPQFLGTLAVVLPVLAVAGLSWSAALDCEARMETFHETLHFLERQRRIVAVADTDAEFDGLVIETESVLLGEVADWFSRRAHTGVA